MEVLLLSLVGATALLSQSKAPPAKLVLPAKNGGIAFDHTAHAKREKNDCKICHSSLFAQDSKVPLAFSHRIRMQKTKRRPAEPVIGPVEPPSKLRRTARTASAISSPEPNRDRFL